MKFSITIPAFKSKYLKEAIDSVLSQSYKDFELIIVDDCSPENLYSIVSRFDDSRIHFYRNSKNCGAEKVVDNWNICLSHCTGDYVICMGDDDKMLPNCLEEYRHIITKYPSLKVYHAWTELIDDNGGLYEIQTALPDFESGLSFLYNRWKGRTMFIGDFCYSAAYLKSVGGYQNLPMAMGSDDITAFKASLYDGIAHTTNICFQYRVSLITLSAPGHKEEVKMDAILKERAWYVEQLKTIDKSTLSSLDQLYLEYITKHLRDHFLVKIKICLTSIIRQNYLEVFKYSMKKKQLGLNSLDILKCIVNSLI